MSTLDQDRLDTIPVLPSEPVIPPEAVILRQARDYIARPRKWSRASWHNPQTGSRCALSAINLYAGVGDDDDGYRVRSVRGRAMKALSDAAGASPLASTNDVSSRIVIFNDSHPKAKVLAIFNQAIASILEK